MQDLIFASGVHFLAKFFRGVVQFSIVNKYESQENMMLTVHHLNQSRSQRVIWALEELSLPYEIVHYQRERTCWRRRRSKSASVGQIPGH
jgi:hypothetical protein